MGVQRSFYNHGFLIGNGDKNSGRLGALVWLLKMGFKIASTRCEITGMRIIYVAFLKYIKEYRDRHYRNEILRMHKFFYRCFLVLFFVFLADNEPP